MITTSQRILTSSLTAGALALALAACGADEPSTPDTATVEPAPVATTEPAETSTPGTEQNALFDGSTLVNIQGYDSHFVVTTAEGAVTTIADPAEAEVPSSWVIEPAAQPGLYQLRSSASTDDRDMCLNLPGDDVVGLEFCDPASTDQQFSIGSLDRVEQVNISNSSGYLVADTEGGLAVEPDPSSPASVFTLIEQGPAVP